MRDGKSNFKTVNSLLPIAAKTTADGTGLGVAVSGYNSVEMVLTLGVPLTALSGSIYWVISFQECATNTPGSFTDIAAANLIGGVPSVIVNADGEASRSVSRAYIGGLPYVRILATGTGTNTNGTPMSGIVILGKPIHAPTAADGAQT